MRRRHGRSTDATHGATPTEQLKREAIHVEAVVLAGDHH